MTTDSTRLDLAIVDQSPELAELHMPTVAAMAGFARAVERASLARGAAIYASRQPAAVRPEPSPAPLHITIPGGPAPVPPWATAPEPERRGRYTGPEASFLMACTATLAAVGTAALTRSCLPLYAALVTLFWLAGSVVAIVSDETKNH
jgi:hypothetical protein